MCVCGLLCYASRVICRGMNCLLHYARHGICHVWHLYNCCNCMTRGRIDGYYFESGCTITSTHVWAACKAMLRYCPCQEMVILAFPVSDIIVTSIMMSWPCLSISISAVGPYAPQFYMKFQDLHSKNLRCTAGFLAPGIHRVANHVFSRLCHVNHGLQA